MPSREDWAAYSGPASFELSKSWHYRLVLAGAGLATIVAVIEAARLICEFFSQGAIWQIAVTLLATWVFSISCFYLLKTLAAGRPRSVLALLAGPFWPLATLPRGPRKRVAGISGFVGYCIASSWLVLSTYFVTHFLSRYLGTGWFLIAVWFLPFNCALPLAGRSLYLDQRARNPLQPIFSLLLPNSKR